MRTPSAHDCSMRTPSAHDDGIDERGTNLPHLRDELLGCDVAPSNVVANRRELGLSALDENMASNFRAF